MKKWIVLGFIFAVMILGSELLAQCPMCKMAAESNLKNGGTAGKGLNFIFFLDYSLPVLVSSSEPLQHTV